MTPIHHPIPALNLRMKSADEGIHNTEDWDLLADQVSVMAQQEMSSYRCGDYLRDSSYSPSYPCSPIIEADQALDALARKKMIDWKFRVVDHFGISRENVATSTSILDRFVFRYRCDRMTFKLAAMTSLYMAAKVHDNNEQLELEKLAILSKGEFIVEDIVEMESKILQVLEWRVNPVTAHSFIHSFISSVPTADPMVARAIYDRAIFFAELCLFDSSYVTRRRSSIAAAAILNALEGIDDGSTPRDCENEFLCVLQESSVIDFDGESLDDLREDLWYIYSMSAQYREDDMQMMMPMEAAMQNEKQEQKAAGSANDMHVSHSPVSVLNRNSS